MYIPKNPKIDAIPPALCTVEEAARILGLKNRSSIDLRKPRFSKLSYALVSFKGSSIVLLNRKEVENLKHKPVPDGYITTREAGVLLGYKNRVAATVLS